MATEKTYGIWAQANGIVIEEVEYDGARHAFEIYVDGRHITTIYAYSPGQTASMKASLDAGEDVRGWEDGAGHYIDTLIAERTGDGLRETLRRLEEDGKCYNDQLDNGADGTAWVDQVNDVYYEYETDDLDLLVNDLTDDELKNVVIRGI